MCGRFSRYTGQDVIEDYFKVDISRSNNVTKQYNIAPSMQVSTVYKKNPVILADMEWGFIPFWSDSKNPNIKPINTRVESLSKKMFSHSFENKRCIIPSNGFYEWKKTAQGKVPYFIRPKDRDLFGFAGIYSIWKNNNSSNEEIYSFSIITTDPSPEIEDIHNRMPVILTNKAEKIWLDKDSSSKELYEVLKPYPHKLDFYPVSTYVNSPKNDSEKCIKKIDKEEVVDLEQKNLDDFF